MKTERGVPLLRQRAPGLPPVPVKLDRPFGGIGERGDAAPARVSAVADRPAVVQRLSLKHPRPAMGGLGCSGVCEVYGAIGDVNFRERP